MSDDGDANGTAAIGEESATLSAGPHLIAALVCDRVLAEASGVISLIRIVDRFTFNIPVETPEAVEGFAFIASLFVVFKPGNYRGPASLRVTVARPDGVLEQIQDLAVEFEGEHSGGVQLVVDLSLSGSLEGSYAFDVFLDDRHVTRTAVQVVHQQAAATASPSE